MNGQQPEADALPISIDDGETIVRAVKTPVHLKKNGNLRPAVFRPKAQESSVSVMRQLMGDDFCKTKGVEIGGVMYVGLLTIKASAIRGTGSDVTDSRDLWLGHADLDHGFLSAPADDPASKDDFVRMTERCEALANASTIHADPAPTSPGWHGKPLRIA